MLTKNDLQQIRGVVQDETEPIKQDVKGIKKDIKALKSDSRYLRKSINLFIEYTEEKDTKIKKRVERIEDHLGFESA